MCKFILSATLTAVIIIPGVVYSEEAGNPPRSVLEKNCLTVDGIKGELISQDWGEMQCSKTVTGGAAEIGGKPCVNAIGTHAKSSIVFNLPPEKFAKFSGTVGMPDEVKAQGPASVEFQVSGNGKTIWKSGILKGGEQKNFLIELTGIKKLELKVGDGGNGVDFDHAMWCNLKFR